MTRSDPGTAKYYGVAETPENSAAALAAASLGLFHLLPARDAMLAMDRLAAEKLKHPWYLKVCLDDDTVIRVGSLKGSEVWRGLWRDYTDITHVTTILELAREGVTMHSASTECKLETWYVKTILNDLREAGILTRSRSGSSWVYTIAKDGPPWLS